MSAPSDLITHEEARSLLGVSPKKMAKMVKELSAYQKPTDLRRKFYSRAEVLKLKEPRAEAA